MTFKSCFCFSYLAYGVWHLKLVLFVSNSPYSPVVGQNDRKTAVDILKYISMRDSCSVWIPGARLTKAYDVTIQRYRNSHAKIGNSKMHILRCMCSKFCVKFQRCPMKFHTKFWTHTPQNMHCIFCGVCVQNFAWNFKGALWNFTQNFEPIHRKICILRGVKDLTTYDILELWYLKS